MALHLYVLNIKFSYFDFYNVILTRSFNLSRCLL